MPINIKNTGSVHEVEQELHSFETQYQMTSAEFATRTSIEDVVSEFDTISLGEREPDRKSVHQPIRQCSGPVEMLRNFHLQSVQVAL